MTNLSQTPTATTINPPAITTTNVTACSEDKQLQTIHSGLVLPPLLLEMKKSTAMNLKSIFIWCLPRVITLTSQVTWSFNGLNTESNTTLNSEGLHQSEYIIESAETSDSGRYKCSLLAFHKDDVALTFYGRFNIILGDLLN